MYSTLPRRWSLRGLVDDYGYRAGTSFAAPHVSGLAALVWSQHPSYSDVDAEGYLLVGHQVFSDANGQIFVGATLGLVAVRSADGTVATRIQHPRRRFGQRAIDYRHYVPELARKPQAVRQVLPDEPIALETPVNVGEFARCRVDHLVGLRRIARKTNDPRRCGSTVSAAPSGME